MLQLIWLSTELDALHRLVKRTSAPSAMKNLIIWGKPVSSLNSSRTQESADTVHQWLKRMISCNLGNLPSEMSVTAKSVWHSWRNLVIRSLVADTTAAALLANQYACLVFMRIALQFIQIWLTIKKLKTIAPFATSVASGILLVCD